MRVLIDTNIALDWLAHREPFHEKAEFIMQACMDGEIEGNIASHSLSDLYYLLRKDLPTEERKQLLLLLLLCRYFHILVESKETIMTAFDNSAWPDLEDGLLMQCAAEQHLDYIITRNEKDYSKSPVKVYSPKQFIEIIAKDL